MTKATNTSYNYTPNIDAYRHTHSRIAQLLIAAGWVKTTDTGQIDNDFLNVTTVPAANTTRDYQVYRFNDTLQATAPIFMRVDFLTGSTVNYPRLDINIGTGSDGAGNITGVLWGRVQINNNSQQDWTYRTNYACVGEGFAWMVAQVRPDQDGNETSTHGFFIDRTRNADGTPNDKGLIIWTMTNGGWIQHWVNRFYIPPGGAAKTQPTHENGNSGAGLVAPGSFQSAFVNDTAYAFPQHTVAPIGPPSGAMLAVWKNDWPRLTEVGVSLFGAVRQWMSFGRSVYYWVPFINTGNAATYSSSGGILLRWE